MSVGDRDEQVHSSMSETDVPHLIRPVDPRLEGLAAARGERVDREIEFLIFRVAQPLIVSILSRYKGPGAGLAPQDVDDLTSTIHLRLVAKLRTLPGAAEPIADFEKYVATLTYNAVNDHLRRVFPARARLKNRLRYTLTHDRRLALWPVDALLVAGSSDWRGARASASEVMLTDASCSPAMRRGDRIGDALVAIFGATRSPVIFDALVSFTARLWHVTEAETEEAGRSATGMHSVNGASHLETRQDLRVLWREIQELRPMQRKALLLNLRANDTVNVASLIVLTGIALFDDLAAVLEMSPEALAAIWNDLPLDDLRIASMLQVTRQQVINLRKSARQRLERRMSR
ncbi:MAG TPA: hypothetical protein VF432_13515 [Thermoanaerobaculia bacterium]